jgi:hypothetical protein
MKTDLHLIFREKVTMKYLKNMKRIILFFFCVFAFSRLSRFNNLYNIQKRDCVSAFFSFRVFRGHLFKKNAPPISTQKSIINIPTYHITYSPITTLSTLAHSKYFRHSFFSRVQRNRFQRKNGDKTIRKPMLPSRLYGKLQ